MVISHLFPVFLCVANASNTFLNNLFVDDLCTGRGVVLGRAATTLRSIETQPFDWMICLVSWTSRPFEAELFLFQR